MTSFKLDRELLESAKINFENFEKASPAIKKHPYYLIAKAQLDEGLGYRTVEESLLEGPEPKGEPV